jgi:hypothetical protein
MEELIIEKANRNYHPYICGVEPSLPVNIKEMMMKTPISDFIYQMSYKYNKLRCIIVGDEYYLIPSNIAKTLNYFKEVILRTYSLNSDNLMLKDMLIDRCNYVIKYYCKEAISCKV